MLLSNVRKNSNIDNTVFSYSIGLSVIFLLLASYKVVDAVFFSTPNYNDFRIPDLMINYQGGFVRRGVLGEMIYQAFLIRPFPLYDFVVYIETGVFLLFLILSCFVFHKLKWTPIMPFAILVWGLTTYRRDFLILLITFWVFQAIIIYVKSHQIKYLMASLTITILSILIYEPSFFIIVPISMLIFYQGEKRRTCYFRKLAETLLVFSVPIAIMIFVCIAKGTTEQADKIWQSWTPLFEYLNMERPNIPDAISFLSKSESISDVAMLHLNLNYGLVIGNYLGIDYNLVLGSLLFFVGMYFLALTIPQKEPSNKLTQKLSSIYLFQFICLLPMFSILSCDFGRTILYVVYSSYYLLFLLKRYDFEISMPYLDSISNKTVTFLQRIPRNKCFLLHLLVIFFIPFNICRGIPIFHSLLLDVYGPYVQKNIIFLQNIFGL